jgi:hypothetical protein
MRATAIQSHIVLAHTPQVVPEHPMRALDSQGEQLGDLKNQGQGRVLADPIQVRDQVANQYLAPFCRPALLFIRGFDLPMKPAQMTNRVHDFTARDPMEHAERPSSRTQLGAAISQNTGSSEGTLAATSNQSASGQSHAESLQYINTVTRTIDRKFRNLSRISDINQPNLLSVPATDALANNSGVEKSHSLHR